MQREKAVVFQCLYVWVLSSCVPTYHYYIFSSFSTLLFSKFDGVTMNIYVTFSLYSLAEIGFIVFHYIKWDALFHAVYSNTTRRRRRRPENLLGSNKTAEAMCLLILISNKTSLLIHLSSSKSKSKLKFYDLSIYGSHFCREEKPLVLKLKKKVRFNLNVKAYEPIPDDDEVDGEEETGLHYEEDVIASSYPASYRYQNCRYSDSEEDGDIDLDEDDDDFSSIQSDNIGSDNDVKNQDQTSVEQQATESISDAGRYVSSVLCPVENLSQWRAVKAKAAIVQPKLQKENLIPSSAAPHSDSKRRSDVAVDASLSNWLSSLEMSPLVKSSSSGQRLGL
ncbi:uncharacterized protein LOC121774827 isoform X1 [Salvia splendens]|uniref:uncharacterized protein LOC121774827 isoform X1 n=1 Tax=Salvia splendens TaxID=180675 RepID=UPI001C27C5CB|nr:uncharacterized protein LOC121774827 isoform X1 [Salvia splendens]